MSSNSQQDYYQHQSKCRTVASWDIGISALCLAMAVILLPIAINNISAVDNQGNPETPVGRYDLWICRIGIEIVSISLAWKLRESTYSESPTWPHSVKNAKRWCYIWLVGCGVNIVLLFIPAVVFLFEAHMRLSLTIFFVLDIIVRIYAMSIVTNYQEELEQLPPPYHNKPQQPI